MKPMIETKVFAYRPGDVLIVETDINTTLDEAEQVARLFEAAMPELAKVIVIRDRTMKFTIATKADPDGG